MLQIAANTGGFDEKYTKIFGYWINLVYF